MTQNTSQKRKGMVLVTGGAGYVGSLLIPHLLQKNYGVVVLDNLMYRQHALFPFFINKNFKFIKGDICDEATVRQALKEVDFIVHLAAIVGEPACKRDPKLCYEVNQKATELLNNLRTPEQKLIFASTGSVYGKIEGVCTEESLTNPVSDYAIAKLKAEEAIKTKPNYVIYRFATAFGLSSRPRLDLLINDFVYRALRQRVNIVYEAHFKRTFLHVYDMVRSFVFAIENFANLKDQIYNVGSEAMNFTKEDIAKKIAEHIPHYLHFADYGTDPDQRNYEVSYAKIKNKGFETEIGIDDGIAELVKGCESLHLHNPFSNIEAA